VGVIEHHRHSKRVTATRRWQVLRHAILERDGWACVVCGTTRRLEVDHIQPVRARPDLAYSPANLQVLCASHHTAKTRLEVGHKPVSEDRQAWRDAVTELSGSNHPSITEGNEDA
jgi:5-methylcytosine-specific restriction endonuclease McrA